MKRGYIDAEQPNEDAHIQDNVSEDEESLDLDDTDEPAFAQREEIKARDIER